MNTKSVVKPSSYHPHLKIKLFRSRKAMVDSMKTLLPGTDYKVESGEQKLFKPVAQVKTFHEQVKIIKDFSIEAVIVT